MSTDAYARTASLLVRHSRSILALYRLGFDFSRNTLRDSHFQTYRPLHRYSKGSEILF